MILIGIVLLILGFVLTVHILWIAGIIVLLVGLILAVLGATGREIAVVDTISDRSCVRSDP